MLIDPQHVWDTICWMLWSELKVVTHTLDKVVKCTKCGCPFFGVLFGFPLVCTAGGGTDEECLKEDRTWSWVMEMEVTMEAWSLWSRLQGSCTDVQKANDAKGINSNRSGSCSAFPKRDTFILQLEPLVPLYTHGISPSLLKNKKSATLKSITW
jgi:hypothetical protein